MKYFFAIFILLVSAGVYGHNRDKKSAPRTEVDEINAVVYCLQAKDTVSYYSLFRPNDIPIAGFDELTIKDAVSRFCTVLTKGEDSGIIWSSVSLQRYEMQKQSSGSASAGYDKDVPDVFKGYIFLKDMLTRRTFCIPVSDIQKIGGRYLGGQVLNVLEASNKDEYMVKEARERRYYDWLAEHPEVAARLDSLKNAADSAAREVAGDDEEDGTKKRREVIDRKYYEGKFDNEIPVKLYVRYMKGGGKNKMVSYDGLYKFGDQKKYVKLEIKIKPDGKWSMEDDVPLGAMELTLKGNTYTGNWTNSDENGYDVVLNLTPIPEKKIEALDKILDQGGSGKVNEEVFESIKKQEDNTDKKKRASKDDDEPRKLDKERKERNRHKKEKADEEKAQQQDTDDDPEWKEEQERAKNKEKKKLRKLYKPKEDDDA